MRQDARLPGARAGKDQQWPLGGGDGPCLLRVERAQDLRLALCPTLRQDLRIRWRSRRGGRVALGCRGRRVTQPFRLVGDRVGHLCRDGPWRAEGVIEGGIAGPATAPGAHPRILVWASCRSLDRRVQAIPALTRTGRSDTNAQERSRRSRISGAIERSPTRTHREPLGHAEQERDAYSSRRSLNQRGPPGQRAAVRSGPARSIS